MKNAVSKNTNKPWLDEKGNKLSDAVISHLGKYWDQETWDRFLKSEGLGYFHKDELLENHLEHFKLAVDWDFHSSAHEEYSLKKYLKKLTTHQATVIYLKFWENHSDSKIAKFLEIKRGSVHTHMKRGLRKLKSLILKDKKMKSLKKKVA